MDKNKKIHPFARYWLNQALALDQWWNVVWGGDPDETVSSRLGKLENKHGGTIKWSRPGAKIIAKCLDMIDKDHCREAIEADEGKDALFI